jgi:type I restriction enzyme S subunit
MNCLEVSEMARKMKDSGVEWIGEIPEEWNLGRIGQLYLERREKVSDRDYKPLSVTMQGIVPQLNTAAKTDAHDDRKLVRKGDFAINSRSDRRGSCGVSSYDGSVSLINTILTPKDDMNAGYYNWLFHTNMFANEYYKWGHGIVDDLWTTGWQDMKRIIIPVPIFKEQEKIALYLDDKCKTINAVIEKNKASIEEYKKLKQAVITQAVTKGVRGERPMKDSGYDFIGEIPEEWEVCKVRHIGILQNGISKGGEFFGEGYPFVSYGDVYRNYALPENVSGLIQTTERERELYSVKKGDIFFTRTSETIEEVGFSSVCEKNIPDATFAGFLIRLRPFSDRLDTEYAKYYFRSEHHRFYLVKEMNLVTRASLGQPLLKGMPVLLPCKEEQKEIADYLDKKCTAIDTLISKKEQCLTELENYKKSLIYEYVTGKKEVPQS